MDRSLYLAKAWIEDRARCAEAGVPAEVVFQTIPALGLAMIEAATAQGVPFAYRSASEVKIADALDERGPFFLLALARLRHRTHVITGCFTECRYILWLSMLRSVTVWVDSTAMQIAG